MIDAINGENLRQLGIVEGEMRNPRRVSWEKGGECRCF